MVAPIRLSKKFPITLKTISHKIVLRLNCTKNKPVNKINELPNKPPKVPTKEIAPEIPGSTDLKVVINLGLLFERTPNSVLQVSAVEIIMESK